MVVLWLDFFENGFPHFKHALVRTGLLLSFSFSSYFPFLPFLCSPFLPLSFSPFFFPVLLLLLVMGSSASTPELGVSPLFLFPFLLETYPTCVGLSSS